MSSPPCTQCGAATRSVTGLCDTCRGGSKGRGIPAKAEVAEAILTPDELAQAACAQTDPEAFFETAGGNIHSKRLEERRAKAICERCDIRARCLEVALTNRESAGIFGGLTARERSAMLRRRVVA